jgi:hypothetical protein
MNKQALSRDKAKEKNTQGFDQRIHEFAPVCSLPLLANASLATIRRGKTGLVEQRLCGRKAAHPGPTQSEIR